MTEQITIAELVKAGHNLQRLAEFVGVRRRWAVDQRGESAAKRAGNAASAISKIICEMTAEEPATPVGVEQPSELEPPGEVSSARLEKFASYLDQLHRWFEARSGARLPPGSEYQTRTIQRSLAATEEALRLLLGETAPEPEPQEIDPDEPAPLTRDDLGPVAVVDPNARLILDHTWQKSLLQKRGGLMELTPDTVKSLDTFLSKQGFELNSHDRRRLYDKVKRWIESMPNKRVLVLRISGLSGKPDVLPSYQPIEEDDAPPPTGSAAVGSTTVAETPAEEIPAEETPDDEAPADEPPRIVKPRIISGVFAPPVLDDEEDESSADDD